jgi:hypothetical protein
MELTLTVNGVAVAPSFGGLAAMGGLAPVGGFIPASGFGASFTPLMKGSTITKELSQRQSTAKLKFLAAPAFAINSLDSVLVEDESFNKHFQGFVTSISERWVSAGLREVEVECHDYTWLLGTAAFTASYSAQSDRAILKDIIVQSGLSGDISAVDGNIEIIEASLTVDFDNMSARDAIEKVASLTSGEWHVNQSKELVYNTQATAAAAAYNCSDVPNNTTTFAYRRLQHSRRFPQPVNQVHVLGGWDNAGTRIDRTRNDTTSQTAYGRTFRREHVDLSIITTALADFLGDAILATNANPEVTASFQTYRDGLDVNTLIELTDAQFGLAAESLLIRRIQLEQTNATQTSYQVECGAYVPRNDRLLRLLEKQSKSRGDTPHAISPVGSITETQISDLAITTPKLAANAVTSDKVTAGELITGTAQIANAIITGGKIANTTITGGNLVNATITGAKIADATITDAKIANATITSAKIVSLDVNKLNAGTITAAISMTSPNITSTSGTNVVSLTGGAIVVSGAGSSALTLTTGNFKAKTTGGDEAHISSAGNFTVYTSSLFQVAQMYNSSGGRLDLKSTGGITQISLAASSGTVNATGSYQLDGVDVINSSKVFSGAGGVSTAGNIQGVDINATGVYKVDGVEVVNAAGAFVGAGVDVGSQGISCGGYSFDGGFNGVTTTFTEHTGKTVTVKGGIITSIV